MKLTLSDKQIKCLDLAEDPRLIELLIGGSAGGSKTMTMCILIVLLCRKYPGVKLFVGRRTLKSLRQSTIATLLTKVHPLFAVGYADYNMNWQNGELRYVNGSLVIFGELEEHPSDPDYARIGSLEIDYAFVDEAGEISLRAKNAIKSRVGRGILNNMYGLPGKVILSCNPAINFLRQEYYDPYVKLGGGEFQKWQIGEVEVDGEKQPAYRGFLRISAYDNPFLPQSYIDNLSTLPNRERKRLLDGNWDYADEDNSLFPSSLLDKSMAYERQTSEKFDKFIGVDVSDKGTDHTVFSLIDNGVLVTQKISSVQMNWNEKSELPLSRLITDELIQFAQTNGFTQRNARNIAVETNGVGVGVRDCLKERGWQITEYVATHQSRSDNYYQLMIDLDSGSTKIWHSLRGLDELRKQLMVHTFEMNNQKPDVLKKTKIKEVLGASPDNADSFMIANYCKTIIQNPQNDPHRNINRIAF